MQKMVIQIGNTSTSARSTDQVSNRKSATKYPRMVNHFGVILVDFMMFVVVKTNIAAMRIAKTKMSALPN